MTRLHALALVLIFDALTPSVAAAGDTYTHPQTGSTSYLACQYDLLEDGACAGAYARTGVCSGSTCVYSFGRCLGISRHYCLGWANRHTDLSELAPLQRFLEQGGQTPGRLGPPPATVSAASRDAVTGVAYAYYGHSSGPSSMAFLQSMLPAGPFPNRSAISFEDHGCEGATWVRNAARVRTVLGQVGEGTTVSYFGNQITAIGADERWLDFGLGLRMVRPAGGPTSITHWYLMQCSEVSTVGLNFQYMLSTERVRKYLVGKTFYCQEGGFSPPASCTRQDIRRMWSSPGATTEATVVPCESILDLNAVNP